MRGEVRRDVCVARLESAEVSAEGSAEVSVEGSTHWGKDRGIRSDHHDDEWSERCFWGGCWVLRRRCKWGEGGWPPNDRDREEGNKNVYVGRGIFALGMGSSTAGIYYPV